MTHQVLFHYPIFNVGGAEISSLRLMKALADLGWEVTLVLTTGGGPMEPVLDPRIRVVRLRPWSYGSRFKLASGIFAKSRALPDLIAYCAAFTLGAVRMLPFLFRRYEAAATLLHGTSTWFIRRVVRAKTRVHWIRNDLSRADPDLRTGAAIATASKEIDYYICVSEVVRQSLVRVVPDVAHKTRVIYNILDANSMRARSLEGSNPFPALSINSLRVLSVCRLSEAPKGLLRMARVCRRLLDEGYQFQWFIVGDGPDRPLISSEIRKLHLDEHMVLLGTFDNPFPAYRHCDIVAVLSNYEGLCGVVNEAKILGKPIIATRFSGIEEQLIHGETGLIVDNDEEAIFLGMSALLTDTFLRERLSVAAMPKALMNDDAKLEEIQSLFLRDESKHGNENDSN